MRYFASVVEKNLRSLTIKKSLDYNYLFLYELCLILISIITLMDSVFFLILILTTTII